MTDASPGLTRSRLSRLLRPLRPYLALAVVSALPYLHTLPYPFVWDDYNLIVENPLYRGDSGMARFWSPESYRLQLSQSTAFYRPIPSLSFAVDHSLWGIRPAGYRLTNILLNALAVCLVLVVFRRLTDNPWIAYPAAILFALHPTHLEAIVWIKCRSELLAAIFFLAGFLIFTSSKVCTAQGGCTLPGLAAAALAYLLAMVCKQSAATLPLVLALWVVVFLPQDQWRRTLVQAGVLLLLGGIYVVGNRLLFPEKRFPSEVHGVLLTGWQHLGAVLVSLFHYLSKLISPAGLSAHHVLHIPKGWADGILLVWFLVLLVAAAAAVVQGIRRRQLWAFAVGWVLITLLPVLNIVMIPGRPLADQRLYIPSVGFILFVTLVLTTASHRSKLNTGSRGKVLIGGCTFVLGLWYLILIASYTRGWRSGLVFWEEALRRNPESRIANLNLGIRLVNEERFEEAQKYLQRALEKDEKDPFAWRALGIAASYREDWSEAVEHFRRAVENAPDNPDMTAQLGIALLQTKEYTEAKTMLNRAQRLDPGCPDAFLGQGLLAKHEGDDEQALHWCREAVRVSPHSATARYHLALLLRAAGDSEEAVHHLQAACRLAPRRGPLWLELGRSYVDLGDTEQATRCFLTALRTSSDLSRAKTDLGMLLLGLGQEMPGQRLLEEVLQENPGNVSANFALARLLLERGDYDLAHSHIQRALEGDPTSPRVLIMLADICLALDREEDAIRALQMVESASAEFGPARRKLGEAWAQLRDFVQARNAFQEAVSANPEDADAWFAMATLDELDGNLSGAIEKYQRASDILGEDWECLFRIGDLLLKLDRPDEALAVLTKAVELGPRSGSATKALAEAYFRAGDNQQATAVYREAARLLPMDPEVWTNLGILLAESGRFDEALEELTKATQLAPDDPRFQANLALGYLKAGKLDRARDLYRSLIRKAPQYVDAYRKLGEAYRRAGQVEEAEQVLRECEEFLPGNRDRPAPLRESEVPD